MKLKEAFEYHLRLLKTSNNTTTAYLDTKVIYMNTLDIDDVQLISKSDMTLLPSVFEIIDEKITRRINGEPVAYIVNEVAFYDSKFVVNNNVLIPRPETEILIDYVLNNLANYSRILDVGTGSGAIAITIKKNAPNMIVDASDISELALEVARENSRIHSTPINFIISNLFNEIYGKYDIITANLPYVPDRISNNNIKYEPRIALYGGTDGLDIYDIFIKQLPNSLNPKGYALIEHEPYQFTQITAYCGLSNLKCHKISEYISRITPIRHKRTD